MPSRRDDSLGTLVIHFSHRFFDTDSPSEESVPRNRLIQFLALITVVSPMLMILVIRGERTIQIQMGELDFSWFQTGIHYTFVCYEMAVMGLVMTFRWDSLFPDRRDYLILAALPISSKRLFAAKAIAVGVILALFAIAANAVLIVFVAFIEPRALAGHIVAVLGASLFAILFFTAVQGVLLNVLPTNAFRRISPSIQMVAIALLITLLLVLPLVAVSLRPLVMINSSLLDYFPPVWFLGIYEVLSFSGTAVPEATPWAWTAMKMTVLTLLVVTVCYAVGYRRHSRKVLESFDSGDLTPGWLGLTRKILHGLLQTNPFQRAVFEFIGKIAGRSSRHRVSSALYSGLGIALALSSLFVIDRREIFPIRLSTTGILEAPAALSFLVVVGWRATFGIPYELPANWVFQMTSRSGSRNFRKAIRKWLFACRIVPLYVLLACFEFAWFDGGVGATHLVVDLIMTAFLVEALFFGFRIVPFTCARLQNKLQLAVYAVAYLFAYTTYKSMMGDLKLWASAEPQHLLRFLASSAIVFGLVLIYRSLTGAENKKFVYDDQDPVYQQLNLS